MRNFTIAAWSDISQGGRFALLEVSADWSLFDEDGATAYISATFAILGYTLQATWWPAGADWA